MEDKITYFAKTNARNKEVTFGIKPIDREKHMYIIGKTGMGKTTLQENMAIQDIKNGHGVAVVDPHGGFADKMLDFVPKERVDDVVYFNPADIQHPIAFNIMEDVGKDQRHLVANGLMGVFKKLWPDVWSARMEYILNNSILALLEYPNSTLLGVNRMMADKEYRKKVVANVTDPVVKAFWEQEFAKYTDRFAAEATPAIQNKVGQFTANPLIRNIIGQSKSSFDFKHAMDEKKIIIANLSKGMVGELNSNLIGAMLITKIYLAAMSRAADKDGDWPPFYLHVDEFQNFATESFKDILSEARKYRLALIIAHQYIEQLIGEGVKEAIFGNVGTHIVFRVGAYDAEFLEKEFSPEFTSENIVNLGFKNIYLKLMIDGVASRPFSAETLPPFEKPEEGYREEVIEASRKSFATPIEEVEKQIAEWHEPVEVEKKTKAGEKDVEPKEEKEPPQLFEAACSVCGKKTVVPFEPDGKRPIYCQKHRSYITESKTKESNEAPTLAEGEVGVPTSPKENVGKEKEVHEINEDNENAISLSQLGEKTSEFRKPPRPKRDKPKPDLQGLRDLLAETQEDENEGEKEEKDDSNILKPGDSVKL